MKVFLTSESFFRSGIAENLLLLTVDGSSYVQKVTSVKSFFLFGVVFAFMRLDSRDLSGDMKSDDDCIMASIAREVGIVPAQLSYCSASLIRAVINL